MAKAPADAEKTASGLASKVLQPGTGTAKPTAEDIVTVHYTGWTTDGKMFDSSYARDAASTFPVNKVIKGWSEGVQLMTVGEKRRLWIPQALAYSGPGRPAAGHAGVRRRADRDRAVARRRRRPTWPRRRPTRRRRPSGLAYKVLRPGAKAGAHPPRPAASPCTIRGWTTDGKLFDSSLMRGQTASFGLDDVIEGWTEGVQLMVPGEKTRFWIPERLAYKGQGNGPKGMLVFDVELLSATVGR